MPRLTSYFGDIIKVTPSSKVVGDMALFLFSRGIKPADVVNLEPGSVPFPESVIDMMMGGLGWPEGGWPLQVWKVILGEKRFAAAHEKYMDSLKKPAQGAKKAPSQDLDLSRMEKELAEKLRHEPTGDDLYSPPDVSAGLCGLYQSVAVGLWRHECPAHSRHSSTAFPSGRRFRSASKKREKILIIRLISISAPDKDGRRTVAYELNGITREAFVLDKGVAPKAKLRPKADLGDSSQIAAPIPGLVAMLSVSVGSMVKKGDKLLDDGGDEAAEHGVRSVRRGGRRGSRGAGRNGRKQGPAHAHEPSLFGGARPGKNKFILGKTPAMCRVYSVPMGQTLHHPHSCAGTSITKAVRFCCAAMRQVAISNWNKTTGAGCKA